MDRGRGIDGIPQDQEPDGNTVVFAAPAGLIVVDTGRHVGHVQSILALAQGQHRKIVAVVNSHWHLDHVSGNPALRSAYPGLRVYSSSAIDNALLPAPFLDTACPKGWQAALVQITKSRFRIAVPGHGPPLTPAKVLLYRQAFESFVACTNSARPRDECGASWADEVKSLLGSDPREAELCEAPPD